MKSRCKYSQDATNIAPTNSDEDEVNIDAFSLMYVGISFVVWIQSCDRQFSEFKHFNM